MSKGIDETLYNQHKEWETEQAREASVFCPCIEGKFCPIHSGKEYEQVRKSICEIIDSGISIGEMANQILNLKEVAQYFHEGWVELDPDQSLPQSLDSILEGFRHDCQSTQQLYYLTIPQVKKQILRALTKASFVKVIKEK